MTNSWAAMLPGAPRHVPKETPSKIKTYTPGPGENHSGFRADRPIDVEGNNYRRQRQNKIIILLHLGLSRDEVYTILKDYGELTYKGTTMIRGSFNKVCRDINNL